MKHFTIAREDGGVSILHVNETDDADAMADRLAKAVANVVPAAIGEPIEVSEADLLADRSFREAWKTDLTVDMQKARDIHRNRMREAREPLLDALDIEYQRADERGDAEGKADITARKQALRDVTADPAIDAATTPDALKAVWPIKLGQMSD